MLPSHRIATDSRVATKVSLKEVEDRAFLRLHIISLFTLLRDRRLPERKLFLRTLRR